jgi:hypothetical protein
MYLQIVFKTYFENLHKKSEAVLSAVLSRMSIKLTIEKSFFI